MQIVRTAPILVSVLVSPVGPIPVFFNDIVISYTSANSVVCTSLAIIFAFKPGMRLVFYNHFHSAKVYVCMHVCVHPPEAINNYIVAGF